ncbi:MAG: IPT/TIG domain-containing protein, partial [bacterium]
MSVAGSNFVPGAAVTFGSDPGTEVDVVSPSLLFVTVPAATSPGPVNVVVTNVDGSSSAPLVNGFTYIEGITESFFNDTSGAFVNFPFIPGESDAVAWADYDNDGDLDIFVAQAFDGRQDSQIDFLFRNTGGSPPFFSDATFDAGVFDNLNGLSAAFGDYTGDGVQDLMVGNAQTAGDVLWFNAADRNDWLVVKLVGSLSNKMGIGARVTVSADLDGNEGTPVVTQTRQVFGGSKGQIPVQAIFGLGRTRPETRSVDELRVFWPSGVVSGPYRDLARNQIVTMFEAPPGILISRVTPGSGPTVGGTTAIVSGENFDPDATVRFGGTQASVVSRAGTNSITVTTPAHPAGLVDVSVTNPSRVVGDLLREATLRNGFLYFTGDPLNTLTIFDPVNTTLMWGSVPGAVGYDVIRGNVSSLQIVSGQVDLGSLVCIENESANTTT